MRSYTKTAFLLYDSDAPGRRRPSAPADELLRRGVSVRVVTLPEGEDPDTFVGTHGARAARSSSSRASIDVFDRKIQLLERHGWFADLSDKRRAIDRLLPTIRAAADPILRDLYVSRASEAAGMQGAALRGRLAGRSDGSS